MSKENKKILVKKVAKAIKESELDVDFAILVKNFRIRRGLTKEKFAKAVNLPLKIIKKIEDG